MYPLDQGLWGPTVRISHLRDELARLTELDLVSGYRTRRRLELARYAISGRLRRLDGIYVESSSFLPAEADIAFLALARGLGIRVLTYIRDAYQLFDEYAATGGVRRRLGARAFRPAIRALRAVSSQLAFPSLGLARALGDDDRAVLLPPGSPAPLSVPRRPEARTLLFVGNASQPAHGADRLIRAVEQVRASGLELNLVVVSRPGEEPPGPHPDWLHLTQGEGPEIAALLPDVLATVIPRPRTPYNDLSVPVKLYDYLAYGRPVLVTDCAEQARVVTDANAGLVMGVEPEAMAEAIRAIVQAPREQVDRWSANGQAAARAESWEHRARRIVELLIRPA